MLEHFPINNAADYDYDDWMDGGGASTAKGPGNAV